MLGLCASSLRSIIRNTKIRKKSSLIYNEQSYRDEKYNSIGIRRLFEKA